MSIIISLLAWIAILSGSAFLIIGAWGTVKFPDFWSRLHAVSVTDSAGMLLLTLGMCLHSGLTLGEGLTSELETANPEEVSS